MISKYPLEVSDNEGIIDAINYLLSGPQGLGQNFAGNSSYSGAVLRPTFYRPFTLPEDTTLDASWYLNYPVTSITPDPSNPSNKIIVTFTPGAPYTSPPFQFGDRLSLTGFADSGLPRGNTGNGFSTPTGGLDFAGGGVMATGAQGSYYDISPVTVTGTGSGVKLDIDLFGLDGFPYGYGNAIVYTLGGDPGTGYAPGDLIKILGTDLGGTSPANDLQLQVLYVNSNFYDDSYYVWSSTTTTVTLYTQGTYNWPAITTYGSLLRDYSNYAISTDCLAQVSVNSVNDRVFLAGQVEFTYTEFQNTSPPLPASYTNNNWDIVVQINRYVASRNDKGNIVYSFQDTVTQKIYSEFEGNPGALEKDSIFVSFIDGPGLNVASYAYILEISFVTKPSIGDGSTPQSAGFGGSPGFLINGNTNSYGYVTAPLPFGTTSGNTPISTISSYTLTVTPIVLSGSGINPQIDVEVLGQDVSAWGSSWALGANYNITVDDTLATSYNANFKPGDLIKILGTDLGGTSPDNDMYLAVATVDFRSLVIPGKFNMGLRSLTAQVVKE